MNPLCSYTLQVYTFSKSWINKLCIGTDINDSILWNLLIYFIIVKRPRKSIFHGKKWQIQNHIAYLKSIKASIIGRKKGEILKSIIGKFWSIIDSSLMHGTHLNNNYTVEVLFTAACVKKASNNKYWWQYASFAAWNYRKKWNLIQNNPSCENSVWHQESCNEKDVKSRDKTQKWQ